ncbi:MAG: 50S ribosomal protein L6 [Firmicutes bacterium]|nr:50S ribosomal protein L6 [candidate division NPL-UPA2 bacterium]MBT9153545.1 50S ribosomal protein L6 [candidate division NPL-UPA2 bacterium]MBT9155244.1 50S ribosomal protein L6 [candidate division NPL-UPA2 bacterium]
MSRIGKKPIAIPSKVEVTLNGQTITVTGPRGSLKRELHPEVGIELSKTEVAVKRMSDSPLHRSLHGVTRTVIANMIDGVTKGYEKKLEAAGVGWRASVQSKKLVLTVGYSHPVEIDPPTGIEFKAEIVAKPPFGNIPLITVSGNDKEMVGQMAATIRGVRQPEPYLGKGIAYVGEKIRRKAGKTSK